MAYQGGGASEQDEFTFPAAKDWARVRGQGADASTR